MREALYYQKLENQIVQCLLCPHHCIIPLGKRGICGVRENIEGILYRFPGAINIFLVNARQ
ncbi:MAG: hypothetical protein ACPLSN_07245, partial [Dictyoglomus turgidum]